MIIQAVHEFNLDLSESVLIGDKASGFQVEFSAGVRTNIYFGSDEICNDLRMICHCIANLNEAKAFL